ncbi:ABC-three component system protein [Halomonas elongata]|uniref:ABC-three component system protein n=1 Tax=Halomonas elongata TaxID=2746 RepID=UPI00186BAF24|nr:ABC-three component system protein [Halomonas elongata]MBW5798617.1 hypothetical protein [Halomonas elongata]
MDISNSDQSRSRVGRDQAGRDIHHVYNYKPTAMSELIDKYENELENESFLNEIIEELQHLTSKAEHDVRGLHDKLESSGRLDALSVALTAKESAAKELLRLPNAKSAQKIYSLVLGNMLTSFSLRVAPLIQEGKPRSEVDAAVQEYVIDPAYQLLEKNPMCLNHLHMLGLYYFLAGNCHISWDKIC